MISTVPMPSAVSVAPVAQKVEYDPLKSFSPISLVSTSPRTVIVNPKLPVTLIAELMAYARPIRIAANSWCAKPRKEANEARIAS